MASISATTNPNICTDRDAAPPNTEHQVLLKALRDFVTPLIQNVEKTGTNDQIPLGPEAGRLITALHDFVSGIVARSLSGAQNNIEVILSDEEIAQSRGGVGSKADEGVGTEAQEETVQNQDLTKSDGQGSSFQSLQDRLHSALRDHVFNTMPIRLLCFDHRGSRFKISLVERGTIHALLSSRMRAKMPEFLSALSTVHRRDRDESNEVIARLISEHAKYAILSHTWLHSTSGEVTYSDWNKGSFDVEGAGGQKLVNFCKTAWKKHRIMFGWMDTVCINKESSSELDESIRSMYKWYQRASVCLIYLGETKTVSKMRFDPWFSRGWTLQELLAPNVILFYGSNWKRLAKKSVDDKHDIQMISQIPEATTITQAELLKIDDSPISRRMQLAATRRVTREEDAAYSLMGIFNVSFSTAYGEGAERAFFRLLQEILVSAEDVLDIFNWAGAPPSLWSRTTRILPTSPAYYLFRSTAEYYHKRTRPMEPLTLTHVGLRIPVILMPGIGVRGQVPKHDPIGDFTGTANISPIGFSIPTAYSMLAKRIPTAGGDGPFNGDHYQLTFAVFNFSATGFGKIFYMKTCMAKCLLCDEVPGKVTPTGSIYPLQTHRPITFDLKKRIKPERDQQSNDLQVEDKFDGDPSSDAIGKDELEKHGMQLISLYL